MNWLCTNCTIQPSRFLLSPSHRWAGGASPSRAAETFLPIYCFPPQCKFPLKLNVCENTKIGIRKWPRRVDIFRLSIFPPFECMIEGWAQVSPAAAVHLIQNKVEVLVSFSCVSSSNFIFILYFIFWPLLTSSSGASEPLCVPTVEKSLVVE